MTVTSPTQMEDMERAGPAIAALLLLLLVTDATAAVATVYWEPAKEVTAPAPEAARVIAPPPTLVTMVTALPPAAEKKISNVS